MKTSGNFSLTLTEEKLATLYIDRRLMVKHKAMPLEVF